MSQAQIGQNPGGAIVSQTALKKMTHGDGNAIMILAAAQLGLQPRLVDDARRQLEGTPIHPMTGAAIEKEAVSINNRLRHDVSFIAKANAEADKIKVQYGFVLPAPISEQFFDVQFEDVGFTSSDLSDHELTESEAAGFTQVAVQENTLPENVVAVVRGQISEDDGQDGEDERKVFANVTLRIRASNQAAAEAFVPPVDLLTKLVDLMVSADDGSSDLALEGNWEVFDLDPVVPAAVSSASEDSI